MIKFQSAILATCIISFISFFAWGQELPSSVTGQEAKMIKLPKPEYIGMILEEAIQKRRSIRNYSSRPMTKAELSQLLFAAQGVTKRTKGQSFRAAPSAGATYPFGIYIVVNDVESLEKGIYRYLIEDHALLLIKSGDFRKKIIEAGFGQDMLGKAQVTFALSAVSDRTTSRYQERGLRYINMEAGHISQNIYLQAVSSGLGSVAIGAFSDNEVNQLFGVDGKKESVIYLHPVGTL